MRVGEKWRVNLNVGFLTLLTEYIIILTQRSRLGIDLKRRWGGFGVMNLRCPSGNKTLYKEVKNSRRLFLGNVNLVVTSILVNFYTIRFQQYISDLPDRQLQFYTCSQYSKPYSLPPTSTYPAYVPYLHTEPSISPTHQNSHHTVWNIRCLRVM